MKNRIISDFLKKYWPNYLWGTIFLVVCAYIETLGPKYLGNIIDILEIRPVDTDRVAMLIIYMISAALGVFVTRYIWRYFIMGNGRNMECYLRMRLFEHFQKMSVTFYNNRKTGDLMAYAINDIGAVRQSFGPGFALIVNGLGLSLLSVFSMVRIVNPKLTLFALLPIPVIIYIIVRMGKTIQKRFRIVQKNFAAISDRIQENISGIRVIKTYVQEDDETEKFDRLNNNMKQSNIDMTRVSSLLSPLIQIFFGISFMINLIYGSSLVRSGEISLGDFAAFNGYLTMIMMPIISIGRIINVFQRGMASYKRLKEIFDIEPEIKDGTAFREYAGTADRKYDGAANEEYESITNGKYAGAAASGEYNDADSSDQYTDIDSSGQYDDATADKPENAGMIGAYCEKPTGIKGDIEIKDLSFKYPGQTEYALKDINIKLSGGRILGIIGRTGSGKTTLANLLLKLYNVAPGSIFIDGRDINEYPLYMLRENIGYVPQDNFLFSASVFDNIRFFNDQYSEDDVVSASKLSMIFDNIMEFPDKFETVIGERGVNLSGGQKQRISIARALIKKPAVYILDDALSAVDTKTEEGILNNLKDVMRGSTCIIIAHRISALRHADEIIVLDHGCIIERGTHDELIAKNGLYHELYREQYQKDLREKFENEAS